MASVIGELEVVLTATSGGLMSGLRTAEDGLLQFANSVSSSQVNLLKLGTASTLVGAGLVGLAAAIGGSSLQAAKEWQQQLIETGNNAGMSATQINEMGKAVLNLSAQTGASKGDLLQAYMYIHDMGFAGKEASDLLGEAAKEALATGSSIADTASTLATVMHEFGIPIKDAANTIDMLHTSASSARLTMQDMVSVFGPVGAQAAAIGVPLDQTAAAFAALTRNGFDASISATQVRDMLLHIMSPASQARTELDLLSKTTGIDLVGDFSQAGLSSKGFVGVLDDLQKATHGNAQEMNLLIPNLRGGLGALVLTGKGHQDFVNILDAEHKSLGSTENAYNQYSKTAVAAQRRLSQEWNNAKIAIGNALLPALDKLFTALVPIITSVADFATKHQALTAVLIAGVAVLGTLLVVLGTVGIAIATLGPVLAAAGVAFGVVAGAISLPVVAIAALVAAIVGLGVIVVTHFNQIKGVVLDIAQFIRANFLDIVGAILLPGVPIQQLVNAVVAMRGVILPIVSAIGSGFRDLASTIGNAVNGIIANVQHLASEAQKALSYVNPLARHSPSLVDQVNSGVGQIKAAYSSLANLAIPAPNFAPSSQNYNTTSYGNTNTVTMNNAFNVTGQASASNVAEFMGFQLEHLGIV